MPKRKAKTVKQEVLEDILGGPPDANPSESPSYSDGTGVRLGQTTAPSPLDIQNIAAKLNIVEEREFAFEELLRRIFRTMEEFESRIRIAEDRLGITKGMRI